MRDSTDAPSKTGVENAAGDNNVETESNLNDEVNHI